MGAKVVGVMDRFGGVIKAEGFTFDKVVTLYRTKDRSTIVSEEMISFEEMNHQILDLEAEIFAPCAASRLITKEQIDRMIAKGLEVISCGANVPFADKEIFFGPIMEYADSRVSLIPDFISNCGMARVFAYFMEGRVSINDELIFKDTSDTIRNAILNIFDQNTTKTNLSKTAFEIALKQLI